MPQKRVIKNYYKPDEEEEPCCFWITFICLMISIIVGHSIYVMTPTLTDSYPCPCDPSIICNSIPSETYQNYTDQWVDKVTNIAVGHGIDLDCIVFEPEVVNMSDWNGQKRTFCSVCRILIDCFNDSDKQFHNTRLFQTLINLKAF